MVVTLGQQYNVGEKSTVILYTYINHHAGTPVKKQKQNRNNVQYKTRSNVYSTTSNMVVIMYCFFIGCKDKASTWYLNGFPDGSNLESTV